MTSSGIRNLATRRLALGKLFESPSYVTAIQSPTSVLTVAHICGSITLRDLDDQGDSRASLNIDSELRCHPGDLLNEGHLPNDHSVFPSLPRKLT